MIEQAQATHRRRSTRIADPQAGPDRVAQIIAFARVWDLDSDLRPGEALPAPRDGWTPCFATAAMRGFLPRTIPATGD